MKDQQPNCEKVYEIHGDGSVVLVDHRWMSDGYALHLLTMHRCTGKCWIRTRGELEGTWRMEFVLAELLRPQTQAPDLRAMVEKQRILRRELAKKYGGRGA